MTPDTALQLLIDERDIHNLVSAYSQAVSRLDPVAAAALFVTDGTLDVVGNKLCTRAIIEDGMRQTFAQFDMLQMLFHAPCFVVQVDTAQASWSTAEFAIRKDGEALNAIFGRYEDDLVRAPDGWLFSRRTFTMAARVQLDAAKLQKNPEFLRDPLAAFSPSDSRR